MIIKGLQRLTLIDYPDKLACTVFTFGCNFRCPYCHNPELVIDDGRKAIEEKEILEFLLERKNFLEGICLTGGEPTLYDDLPDFLSEVKELGFSVKLDTNGTSPQMLERLIEGRLVDYIAMDIKAPREKYETVTQVSVKSRDIQKSIELICDGKIDYELRTTVVPSLLGLNEILAIGQWLSGARRFVLQQFKPAKTLEKSYQREQVYTREELEDFAVTMGHFFGSVSIRGA